MSKHSTHKSTVKGKSATLAKREARARKYAPDATLTKSSHVRTTTR
jgi:hypothetical protein